nr:hypothetical protein Iba_chr10fCG7590 [Ipomoea batatas]
MFKELHNRYIICHFKTFPGQELKPLLKQLGLDYLWSLHFPEGFPVKSSHNK